jgi:hypothetical protein
MWQQLIKATTLISTLAITTFIQAFAAPTTIASFGKLPSIESSVQFPQKRQLLVRHSFKIDIPAQSQSIAQIKIYLPK